MLEQTLKLRGGFLSDEEQITEHRVGYCDAGIDSFAAGLGSGWCGSVQIEVLYLPRRDSKSISGIDETQAGAIAEFVKTLK